MSYTITNAIADTRIMLNDTTENVWTDNDIVTFCNEAIRIVRKSIPEFFTNLKLVKDKTDTTAISIPEDYENLIPLFAFSRCMSKDEQHYRAATAMNEFEARRQEMVDEVMNSSAYEALDTNNDYVRDVYFRSNEDDIV